MANPSGKRPPLASFIVGNLCMLFAAIFWGANLSVTKALIPEWMTADGISAVRLIGGCVLFWITSLFVRCPPIVRADWRPLILGGVVGQFAFIVLLVLSLRYGNAIDISIILTLPPMFVILIGVLFHGERPGVMEYAGVALSFAGAAVVIAGAGAFGEKESMATLVGDFLAVLSSLCFALYLVFLEKPSHTYRPLVVLRWVFLFAAIPGLVLVPGMQTMPILHTGKLAPWLGIGFILFGPTYFAYFLTQPGIKRIGSELASLYQYLVPVFAAISAVLMGLEQLNLLQVVAMLVIVAGMILVNMGRRKRA